MRKLGLKTKIIKEALRFLIAAQLIAQLDDPKVGIYEFKTTEKGRTALNQFYTLVTQFFTEKT